MDRFVWFILLVVMSHLVTEFTRVTGYARGNRQELAPVNETLMAPKSVRNMVLNPGQEQYGLYEQVPPAYYYQNNQYNQLNRYPPYVGNMQQQAVQPQQPNAQLIIPPTSGTQQGFTFSFRPLIDSIFDIPISTLRAVNSLVARLTGSYQAPTADASAPQKSASSLVIETERSSSSSHSAYPATLREEIA